MAAALRSLTRTAVVTARANFRTLPAMPTTFLARSMSARAGKGAVSRVEEDPKDIPMGLDEGLEDPLFGMPSHMRRRVMALKEVQAQYDDINRVYQRELAQLQAKYLEKYSPLFEERKQIVTGAKAVGDFGIEDDGEADEKHLPGFWLTAMSNHNKVGPYITDRDAEVLSHLVDVRVEVMQGEDRGFKLFFEFEKNKYFDNKVLEKTYLLEPEDDLIPKQFVGTKINWKSVALDPTTEQKKKRVKGRDGKKGGKPTFVVENIPCESFFNFFDPPQVPDMPSDLSDEQMDALQEELSVDFDIGFSFKENLIPRAVEWFTGEIGPIGDDEFDEDMEEFEEEEEEEPAPEPRRRR